MENPNGQELIAERAEFEGVGREMPLGPLELNLLERVELGLAVSEDRNNPSNRDLETPQNESDKYEGKREVIFVSGWVNICSVYERYKWGFIVKIIVGLLILLSLNSLNQNFWPVAAAFCIVNLVHMVKNVYFLYCNWDSSSKIKMIFWLEFHIALGYFIFFFGFLLLMTDLISTKFFLLYSAPYLLLTMVLFFANSDENFFFSQKKFSILEGFQFLLISLKYIQFITISWNYVLIFFMAASVYVTVLGILMSIILACSLFGFIFRQLETWKVKALVWMTFYYLSSGLIYIYLIKGVVHFYGEEDFFFLPSANYITYRTDKFEVLATAAIMMIAFSIISLAMHLLWREEIKRFLTKIIYKNELRKEISVRFLTKSFTFKLIQVSATYFIKPDNKNGNKNKPADLPTQADQPVEPEMCTICFEESPNIMMDPCGHGGVCKSCIVTYLKGNEGKCPYCKQTINRLFLIDWDKEESQFKAKGEIKFRV